MAEVVDLSAHESRVYSQNGEDGVIAKIFEVVGTTNRFCLEFGVQDGTECNTRALREAGWPVVMWDAHHHDASIGLHRELVGPQNAEALFAKYRVPYDLDLLSVDIDSLDFYVTAAILRFARPRVCVTEYNASFPPPDDRVVAFRRDLKWDGSYYFGASLAALDALFTLFGYGVVHCEARGVNAFFVRDDVLAGAAASFANARDVARIYRLPRYGYGPRGGHPPYTGTRPWITARAFLEQHRAYLGR
jgi:hypothetical protein